MKTDRFILFTFFALATAFASAQESYKYLSLDMQKMEQMKKDIKTGNNEAQAYLSDLKSKAESAVKNGPYSVTSKKAVPPSGDKHDYLSMGPYWWPDPSKPDGKPYIRRDGEINPERNDYSDHSSLGKLTSAVSTLGLAYYYTGDDEYVKQAEKLLTVFFIDPETKMNPNLKYGQFIPGICDGRGIGIIETASLSEMLQGVALLSDSPAWSKDVHAQLQKWIGDYLHWLQTDAYGIDERNAKNNHGTHYDAQSLSMYLFLNDVKGAREHIAKYTIPRMEKQIKSDGSMPLELARTKSWGYDNMNMRGFIQIAMLAEKIDVDLWHYQNHGQMYIKSMIDWFIPYLKKEKEWTWKQIVPAKVTEITPVLEIAAKRYNDSSYLDLIKNLQPIHKNITK